MQSLSCRTICSCWYAQATLRSSMLTRCGIILLPREITHVIEPLLLVNAVVYRGAALLKKKETAGDHSPSFELATHEIPTQPHSNGERLCARELLYWRIISDYVAYHYATKKRTKA